MSNKKNIFIILFIALFLSACSGQDNQKNNIYNNLDEEVFSIKEDDYIDNNQHQEEVVENNNQFKDLDNDLNNKEEKWEDTIENRQKLKKGDKIGGMFIDSISVFRNDLPFSWENNAIVTFVGEIDLLGRYEYSSSSNDLNSKFVGDPGFFVDDNNYLKNLPFGEGFKILSFENEEKAQELLIGNNEEVKITIDKYIHIIYPAGLVDKIRILDVVK